MRNFLISAVVATAACGGQHTGDRSLDALAQRAQSITIVRDTWGIPHVYGKTDADAVFGVMYAQAEDDFNRVETNLINAMGRLAEAEGEQEIYRDLRMKIFIDPNDIKAQYEKSPEWLKALMNAWADGLNYFLRTHPHVTPRVIKQFEPWMALTFTEGSIGGDIERVSVEELKKFYSTNAPRDNRVSMQQEYVEPTGSNGIAIAPSNTTAHRALLLINPHTSFFFRAEAHMSSDEGLNAYGALTWGQFFVYQGFNDRAGWMHTSSGVDNIDEYVETIFRKNDRAYYRYGSEERPVTVSTIVVPYKAGTGMAKKEFIVYRTHHGPIVRGLGDKWISVRLMQDPVKALVQSFSRTKARTYTAFRERMELHTNSSNNTVYADADGNIAYFHANFIPRRSTAFDWANPVDGSTPATEWGDVLSIEETPGLLNPPTGWLYNTNNWPWTAAGASSPKKSDFPPYVERNGENSRGIHAIRVLQDKKDFTLESLIAAAYDNYLPSFAIQIPALVKAFEQLPASNPLKAKLAEQIAMLKAWNFRWDASSVPTALAVYWGEEIGGRFAGAMRNSAMSADDYIARKAPATELVESLAVASDKLTVAFGNWKIPWGDINRYQRLNGNIVQKFDDAQPSVAVPFTSGRWGSLASFGARTYPGTKKMYGTTGNSFVAAIEFGDRVRAKAITAGGESGDPRSSHFGDQAERYARGELRDVYFYRPDIEAHAERSYHPGSSQQ